MRRGNIYADFTPHDDCQHSIDKDLSVNQVNGSIQFLPPHTDPNNYGFMEDMDNILSSTSSGDINL